MTEPPSDARGEGDVERRRPDHPAADEPAADRPAGGRGIAGGPGADAQAPAGVAAGTGTDTGTGAGEPAGAPTGPGWRRRRARWAVLVLLGWIALIGAVLVRPGGAVGADRPEVVPMGVQPLAGLPSGGAVEQTFTAGADGLSTVDVRFGTYRGQPVCRIVATVVDPSGAAVAAGERECASLPDAALTPVIDVAPVPGTAGEQLRLRLQRLDDTGPGDDGDDLLTLFGTPPTAELPAAVAVPGGPQPLAVEVHTGYGDDARAWDQVGTALGRIGEFGPFWTGPVFVVLLVLGIVALTIGLVLTPWRTALVLLVVLAVAKGVLWSVVLPTFQGADEPAHVAYAQYMAETGQIPKRDHPANDLSYLGPELEVGVGVFRQPYVRRSDRPDFGAAAAEDRARLQAAADGERSNSGDGPASGYPPHYYAVPALLDAVVPGTIDVRVGAMRLWSVALGAVAVAAAALAGRRLFPRAPAAALLLGVAVAFHPMFSQQTATVNNDALLLAGGALCVLAALALVEPGRSRWWAPAAGAFLGLAVLGKPLALAFVPVLLLAWGIGRLRRAGAAPWWWEVLGAGVGLVVTYGTWFAASVLFGFSGVGIRARETTGPTGLRTYARLMTEDHLARFRGLWSRQFWGEFAWVDVSYPQWVYDGIGWVMLAVTALVAWWLVRAVLDGLAARRGEGPWRTVAGATLAAHTAVCLTAVAATVTLVHALDVDYFRKTGVLEFAQGRYGLMITVAVLALPALLLARLVPRLSPVVTMGVVAVGMVVLNVWGLALVAERFYL